MIHVDSNMIQVGMEFLNREAVDTFWEFTCPCGKKDTYPVNGLPEVDTLHSCGDPNHWIVKYRK